VGFQPALDTDGLEAHPTRNNLGIFLFVSPLKHYPTEKEWQKALKLSDVRSQWDPDHDPKGNKLERRAIQLGLRGEFLANYARDKSLQVEDISKFVSEQRQNITSDCENLIVPVEKVYPILDSTLREKLELTQSYTGSE
jgi:Domain of unknown function (DUF4291)